MKKFGLLILTSLVTCISCGDSVVIEAKIDPIDAQISIHQEDVSNFYQSSDYDYSSLPATVNAGRNVGDNNPIEISWTSNASSNQRYKVVLNDGEQTLNYTVKGNSFEFYNYKLNTTYQVHLETGNYRSESASFTTPSGFTRTIKVEGVPNFRDLGGYGNIKQGLLYRCMTLENNTIYGSEYVDIPQKGNNELLNLGIKSEIDLRKESERGENFNKIPSINYQFKPLYYGGENILTYKDSDYDNPAILKEIFEFMAVETNYPMIFHCVRGTDRTGCIAFVIKGLLGVAEEFLKKDFIFSNFYNIGSPVRLEAIENPKSPSSTQKYVNVLKQEEGNNLQEKIYNYLKNKIGVSEENINSIINILKANNE